MENKTCLVTLSLGVPSNKLFGFRSVLAVAYLTHKAAEHIRKISRNELCAVDIIRANVAFVKSRAGRARRKFILAENVPAIRVMLTVPIITYHNFAP